MNALRSVLSASAYAALLCLGLAGCGSPVVGLECQDGFTRCGLACYDLTNDHGNCGACFNDCGEGHYCAASMCMEGTLEPDGAVTHHGDGSVNPGDGSTNPGDGSTNPGDGSTNPGDGSVNPGDGSVDRGDGGVDIDASRDGGDGGFDMDASHPVGVDDAGHSVVTLPDGAVLYPPDGSTILPDGAIIQPDGAVFFPPGQQPDGGDGSVDDGGNDGGNTVVVVPPPCMGPLSDPTCVCGLGTVPCGGVCVNTNTDHENCGMCGFACAAAEYCSFGACAPICTAPLVLCNGQCIDFSSDYANCGGCNLPCVGPAACILNNTTHTGECVGAAVGHIVVVGHDLSVVTQPIRQMVGNAVFLRPRNPVRILAYDVDTSVQSRVGVSSAIQQSSTAIGRAYTLTTADPTLVTQQLGDADVFVIETQQNAMDLDLQTLGAAWSSALHTFLFRGGVILLLDGGSANNAGTYQILNAATVPGVSPGDPPIPLFDASGRVLLSQRILTNVKASDAIGAAVPTAYQSQGETVGFSDVPSGPGTATTVVVRDTLSSLPILPGILPATPARLPVVLHTITEP